MVLNVNEKKLQGVNQLNATNATAKPYESPTTKALKSGTSIFTIAANKNAQSNPHAAKADTATNNAESGTKESTNDIKNIKEAQQLATQEDKEAETANKSATSKMKKNTKQLNILDTKIKSLDKETQSLQAERDSLDSASNPFDGTGSKENSAFSLAFGEDSQNVNTASNNQTTDNKVQIQSTQGNDKNQEKIAELDEKIADKTMKSQGLSEKQKLLNKQTKSIFNKNVKSMTAASNIIVTQHTKATNAQTAAEQNTQLVNTVQSIGATTTGVGYMLLHSIHSASLGAKLVKVGTATTTAGKTLSSVASKSSNQAKSTMTTTTIHTNKLAELTERFKQLKVKG